MRWLWCVVLLVGSLAVARDPGDETGLDVTMDGASVIDKATKMELPSSSFMATDVGNSTVQLELSTDVTMCGVTVGDELGEWVFYDGGTTDQTCGSGNEGKARVLDTGELQYCDGSTTSVREVALASGLTGGQTWYGGTAATDELTINPSTSASARGAINVCASGPSVGTNSVQCLKPFDSGLTISGGSAYTYAGVQMDATVTQDTNGGVFGDPSGRLFSDVHTHTITDSALNATVIGSLTSFYASPTLKNETNDNLGTTTLTASFPGMAGLSWTPTYVKSSTGTLTCNAEYGLYSAPSAIPSGVTVTRSYGAYHFTPTVSGTLTHAYGFYTGNNSATNVTNIHPYAAGEIAITGSTESGIGDWGVESGSPNRFYFRNESGHIWRMGYTSNTGTGLSMSTSATHYFAFDDRATTTATETSADSPVPGALKVHAIACGVTAAPGSAKSWTFTVRDDAADVTGTSCAISGTSATSCTARIEAGTAVAAASLWNLKVVPSGTPAAADGTCTVWWTLDAF